MSKTPDPPPYVVRSYRQPVVGPGPHLIQHNLGIYPVVILMNDALQALLCRIDHVDLDSCEVTAGYFSWEGEWVPGCRGDAILHVLANA